MRRLSHPAPLALALLLALPGCVVVPPRVVTITTIQSQPQGKQAGALPGQRQRVDFIAAANPDCTISGYVTIELVAHPVHGAVEVQRLSEFGYWPPGNPRSRCNDHRLAGLGVFYTSEPAFRGTDRFTMSVLTPNGFRYTVPINVAVQ